MRNFLPLSTPGRRAASALLLALAAGCAASLPQGDTGYAPCKVLGSSDWKAHVEFASTSSPIP